MHWPASRSRSCLQSRPFLLSERKALERTNIVFPRSSSILHWRRYLARTLPAGHNCPPQPSFRSVCRMSGGVRRPEKSRVVVVGRFGGREGTRSSVTNRKDSDPSRLWVDEAAMLWLNCRAKCFTLHCCRPRFRTNRPFEGSRTILYSACLPPATCHLV